MLPGVGAFADCRRGLAAVPGMIEALTEAVRDKGRPFLGICVGMQLMAARGLEHEVTKGFGWISGDVAAIAPKDKTLKIPHMGWNTLDVVRAHPLLAGIPTGPQGLHAYFVHSYAFAGVAPQEIDRLDRLRRRDHCHRRARQYGRHAISSGKEPSHGAGPDRQFSAVAAVILYPAIDLKGGDCVRLLQGDMDKATVFNKDPAAQAAAFAAQGFTHLHVVDLDGAFAGKPMNAQAVEKILGARQNARAARRRHQGFADSRSLAR